jgi:hypothetical protein
MDAFLIQGAALFRQHERRILQYGLVALFALSVHNCAMHARLGTAEANLQNSSVQMHTVLDQLSDTRRQIHDIHVRIDGVRRDVDENKEDCYHLVHDVQVDVSKLRHESDNLARDTRRRIEELKDDLLATYPSLPADLRDQEARAAMGLFWGEFIKSRDRIYEAQLFHVPSGYDWMKACERTQAPDSAPVVGFTHWCEDRKVCVIHGFLQSDKSKFGYRRKVCGAIGPWLEARSFNGHSSSLRAQGVSSLLIDYSLEVPFSYTSYSLKVFLS